MVSEQKEKKLTDREKLIALLAKKKNYQLSPKLQPNSQQDGRFPASYSQQRIWLIENINKSPQYNIPYVMRVSGEFDILAAQSAINSIIKRHKPLRMSFSSEESRLFQVVKNDFKFEISLYSIDEADPVCRQNMIDAIIDKECKYIFDLDQDLMIRAAYLQLSEPKSGVLVFNMHHIASDGWSMGIFVNEFVAQYEAIKHHRAEPFVPLEIQYTDFAIWQRELVESDKLKEQIKYWSRQMSDVPYVHSLPLSKARPKIKQYEGGSVNKRLSPLLSQQLLQLSKKLDVTPFMLLHAAIGLVFSRHGNSQDIVIATPVAGRSKPELEPLIGYFANTLVLRTNTGHVSFEDYLHHVKQVNLDAQANQDIPVEQVIELCQLPRSMQHTPLFQIMFSMDTNEQKDLNIPGLTFSPYEKDNGVIVKFDLEINADITQDIISLNWNFDCSIFTESYIEILSEHLHRLLIEINNAPTGNLVDFTFLSNDETHYLLHELNDTQVEHSRLTCVHKLFELTAARSPDSVAAIFGNKQLTYGELNQRANQLAHYLVEHRAVTSDHLVGICVERSLEMLVAILAILKAGGAYVPLDPNYPNKRLAYMLEDADLTTVLTIEGLKGQIPLSERQAVYLDSEEMLEKLAKQKIENIELAFLSPNNLAYVIYTSGSTGKPKGVMVEHRNVANFLLSMQKKPGIDARETLLAVTSISFDIHVLELFLGFMVFVDLGFQLQVLLVEFGGTLLDPGFEKVVGFL